VTDAVAFCSTTRSMTQPMAGARRRTSLVRQLRGRTYVVPYGLFEPISGMAFFPDLYSSDETISFDLLSSVVAAPPCPELLRFQRLMALRGERVSSCVATTSCAISRAASSRSSAVALDSSSASGASPRCCRRW